MSYRGSWKIDDYLTFCCNTHDPDTGVATDADAVPTYRVYEDETATPILTGSMALLDDANTVGFYSERIQLTAANGFEKGKCYTIYIPATVDSDTGTTHHFFQIEAEVDANTVSDLHADLDDGGRLDLLIDAIKAVTDVLPNSGALSDLATILADTNELQTDDIPGKIAALNDPTAATIADAVWDEATSGHTGAGTTGKALTDGITAGSGAITFTYTLTSSVDSSPIGSATIWVTTDQAGSNVVASGTTNTSGEVTFYLDAGTYYVWREKSGWNFTNPDTETVS